LTQCVADDCSPNAPVFSRYDWPRWLTAMASMPACSSVGTTSAISSAALSTMRATRSSTSTGSSFSRCALTRSLIWQCRHSAMGRLILTEKRHRSTWGGFARNSSRRPSVGEALLGDRLGRHDLDAEAGEADVAVLGRGEEPDRRDAEVFEDLRAEA